MLARVMSISNPLSSSLLFYENKCAKYKPFGKLVELGKVSMALIFSH